MPRLRFGLVKTTPESQYLPRTRTGTPTTRPKRKRGTTSTRTDQFWASYITGATLPVDGGML